MKSFVLNNWYKIAIAFSSITFSSAFLIYSLKNNPVQASPYFKKEMKNNDLTDYNHVVALPDGNIYGVHYDSYHWVADFLTNVHVSK